MTSLIFGTALIAHKTIIGHRREKNRVKNYERWEDLRDDYDEQRKISRESRSLDIQRTGAWDGQQYTGVPNNTLYDDRPILTLRDQQEANDARASWRPQEQFDGPPPPQIYAQPTGYASTGHLTPQYTAQSYAQPPPQQHQQYLSPTTARAPLKSQKTGATWDDGLPAPLQVSRRSFDDYDHNRWRSSSATPTRTPSFNSSAISRVSTNASESGSTSDLSRQSSFSTRPGVPHAPSGLRESVSSEAAPTGGFEAMIQSMAWEKTLTPQISGIGDDAIESHVPGGRMAELIERGY